MYRLIFKGDFCYPIDKNKPLITRLEGMGVPYYSVMGNHDTDCYPNTQVMEFLGMPHNFYSFTKGSVKFIVLDTCYIQTPTGYQQYLKRNYDKSKDIYPIIPPEELAWLERELSDRSDYYVIFSHHSLENNFGNRGVHNRNQVREVINKANQSNKKVLLCMNGHDHGSAVSKIKDTYYYALNSISYIWHGPEFEHFDYPAEIHNEYPYLKNIVLYNEGLYAVVTLYEDGKLEVQGMNASYQTITPKELGMGNTWNGRSIEAVIPSLLVENM